MMLKLQKSETHREESMFEHGDIVFVATTVCSVEEAETPEIVVFPVTGGLPDYLAWVRESCRDVGEKVADE